MLYLDSLIFQQSWPANLCSYGRGKKPAALKKPNFKQKDKIKSVILIV
jgi:hypothetical protein